MTRKLAGIACSLAVCGALIAAPATAGAKGHHHHHAASCTLVHVGGLCISLG